jgi:hypothetical protein
VEAPTSPQSVGSPLGIFSTRRFPTKNYHPVPPSVYSDQAFSNSFVHSTPFLEYGMIVSLTCDDRNGVVCAEGFASRDVRLEKFEPDPITGDSRSKLGLGSKEQKLSNCSRVLSYPFRDCLFEIVPKMTYDATIALEELQLETSWEKSTFNPSTSTGINTSVANTMMLSEKMNRYSISDLKFKSDAEIRLNAMMYKKLRGTQVKYGHVSLLIQYDLIF